MVNIFDGDLRVIAIRDSASDVRKPWRWEPVMPSIPEKHGSLAVAEDMAAAEECRAALAAALACLPEFTYPFTCPYDEQQCERPRCYLHEPNSECAKRRAAAPARRRPCAP